MSDRVQRFTASRSAMIIGYQGVTLAVVLSVLVAVFALSASGVRSSESSAVLCVSPEGNSDASGECWHDPLDLHTALRTAEPGDQVWIRQGRYFPGDSPNATFWMPEEVEIRGGFTGSSEHPNERDTNPFLTVLDGRDVNYTVVTAAGISSGMLNGVTIVNGAATVISDDAIDLHRRGGGIYVSNSSPTFQNVLIANNRARFGGGGAYVDAGSSPTFRNVVFQGNSLTHPHSGRGGGLRVLSGEVTLDDVTFRHNEAVRGGGLYIDDGTVTIDRSLFGENRSNNQGGAIAQHRGDLRISDTRMVFNESGTEGGALLIGRGAGEVFLTNLDVIGNESANSGGGIEILGGEVTISHSALAGNVTTEHGGGGLAARDAHLYVRNSLIQGNSAWRGGGLLLHDSTARIINTIVSGNFASSLPEPKRDVAEQPEPEGMPYAPLRRSITGEMIPATLPDGYDGDLPQSGGGILVAGVGTVEMINTTITGNFSTFVGAGVYRSGDSILEITNSIVYGNLAGAVDEYGGNIHPAAFGLFSIAERDHEIRLLIDDSVIGGGCPDSPDVTCRNVHGHDPRFLDPVNPARAPTRAGDFTMWFTSPAIDLADSLALADDIDADAYGNERFVAKLAEPVTPWNEFVLDIGAVETPLRRALPDQAVLLDHTGDEYRIRIDVSSDQYGRVRGTVELVTDRWMFRDVVLGKIYSNGNREIALDGEAVLGSGHLVGFLIELEYSGIDPEPIMYRLRLDNGVDSGWKQIESN